MKPKTLHCCQFLFLYLLGASLQVSAQENQFVNFVSAIVPASNKQANDETYASIFLYYPFEKSGIPYAIFLNKKNIGKISNGGRLECKLIAEGPVAITIIEGSNYREPLTQSKNSRTITINKGKSYYFRVTGSGSLEYNLNAGKGQSNFAEDKEFTSQPTSFIETPDASIPSLQSKNN